MIKLYCEKCGKLSSLNEKSKEVKDLKFPCKTCKNPKNEMKLIFDVEITAQESLNSKKELTLQLNTYDSQGVI